MPSGGSCSPFLSLSVATAAPTLCSGTPHHCGSSSTTMQVRPSQARARTGGKGRTSRGRAGASRARVPGRAAAPCGSWQAAENKLLLVPSGCCSGLGCQLRCARAALVGLQGYVAPSGSRWPRGIPSLHQPLCQTPVTPALQQDGPPGWDRLLPSCSNEKGII